MHCCSVTAGGRERQVRAGGQGYPALWGDRLVAAGSARRVPWGGLWRVPGWDVEQEKEETWLQFLLEVLCRREKAYFGLKIYCCPQRRYWIKWCSYKHFSCSWIHFEMLKKINKQPLRICIGGWLQSLIKFLFHSSECALARNLGGIMSVLSFLIAYCAS